jgi:hypothetical protein
MGVAQALLPNPLVTYFPAVRTFSIAGLTMPGKWTLLEADKQFGWQIQKGYALSGAFCIATGDELVVAKFLGEFWASVDFAVFKSVHRPQLLKNASFLLGGTLATVAMGIDHPELKAQGVTSVVCLKVGIATQTAPGLWSLHVDFMQFRPPVIAKAAPKTKIPDIAPPQPVATSNQQVEIQNNNNVIGSLLGGGR